MSRATVDILRDWINSIDNTFTATSATNGVIAVSCTGWAVEGGFLSIGVDRYTITEVVQDTSITISDNTVTNGSTFTYTLEIPYYLHGTPRQATTDKQLKAKEDVKTTPLFYLFEPITERFNNELDAIEREVDLRIGVLNNFKNEQNTINIYDYSLRAMRNLAESLVNTILSKVTELDPEGITYTFVSYPKYSNQISESGGRTNIFNENLSGIDLTITIPLKRLNDCKEC